MRQKTGADQINLGLLLWLDEKRGSRHETYRDAIVFCDRPHPVTPIEGKFSLQHAAAVAWRHGDAGLERFTPEALLEAEAIALRARVSVSDTATLTARYPAHFGAMARARLANGRVIEARAADALGDSENPMDSAAIVAKARALMAWGGLDAAAIDQLIEVVLNLGQGGGVADLSDALPGTDA